MAIRNHLDTVLRGGYRRATGNAQAHEWEASKQSGVGRTASKYGENACGDDVG